MSLNPTTVIRRIESRLGMSHHILELSKFDIMETVIQDTLPTFSTYYPYLSKIQTTKCDKVEDKRGLYYLKTDLDIISVSKVVPSNYNLYSPQMQNMYMDPFSRQIMADGMSAVENPILFEFIAPNQLEIFPKNMILDDMMVELKCVHPSHMMTIPFGLREEFLKLAFLDVCMALYPIRYHFSQLNTTFGSIEVVMQNLESAEDKRTELLETWRTNFNKQARRRKIYMY